MNDPRVTSVKPLDSYKLELTFTNNTSGIFDCSPYLDKGVFKELKDVKYFKQVRVSNGTVTWPHHQDFCPDTLFLKSRLS